MRLGVRTSCLGNSKCLLKDEKPGIKTCSEEVSTTNSWCTHDWFETNASTLPFFIFYGHQATDEDNIFLLPGCGKTLYATSEISVNHEEPVSTILVTFFMKFRSTICEKYVNSNSNGSLLQKKIKYWSHQ